MKTRIVIGLIFFICSSFFLIEAAKDNSYGLFKPTPIKFVVPKGWPKPSSDIFTNNKLTEEGFALGRKLFHDGNLSKDGNISCGSCHQQFAAFSTFDHDLSHGVNNTFSKRNAPVLFNLAWMKELHWDGGINHIEVQPLSPITAENEMGENMDSIIIKLNKDLSYRSMFRAAFGDPQITGKRLLKALAQFTGSLVSANSKYDKVKRGEATFTLYEQRGYNLYKANCAACHAEPFFTDFSYRNNGLTRNSNTDLGRYGITRDPADSFKFKVPSLRNIQVSFPYMHDGRIYSVPQVIDHYTSKIETSQRNLDPLLKNRLAITRQEKTDLTYFLYTLTDSSFLKDKRFGPPSFANTKQVDGH